jgi:hypothetical protein
LKPRSDQGPQLIIFLEAGTTIDWSKQAFNLNQSEICPTRFYDLVGWIKSRVPQLIGVPKLRFYLNTFSRRNFLEISLANNYGFEKVEEYQN